MEDIEMCARRTIQRAADANTDRDFDDRPLTGFPRDTA